VLFDDATGLGTVSITNYAQGSLGDVVFVELPTVGTEVGQGGKCHIHYDCVCSKVLNSFTDQIGAVESVKAASDIVRATTLYVFSSCSCSAVDLGLMV
jgi:glycine cleavage system H protein